MLLDTCSLLWLASDPSQFSTVARRSILRAQQLLVSDMSAWEIGIAVAKNRIVLQLSPIEWFEQTLARYTITSVPVTWRVAIASTALPQVHSDPCDRIIIATAIAENVALISPDRNFPRYPDLQVIW